MLLCSRIRFFGALAALSSIAPVFSHSEAMEGESREMTVSRFMAYIDAFNRHNMDFVDYYVSDIVFDKDEGEVLEGREEVAQWYADFWKENNETVTVNSIVIDNSKEFAFADITIKVSAKAKPNQGRIFDEVIFYELAGGQIRSIRGVYHQERRH